jgi:hypothetical protein
VLRGWSKISPQYRLKLFRPRKVVDFGPRKKSIKTPLNIFNAFWLDVEDVLFEDLNIILQDIVPKGKKFTVDGFVFRGWLRVYLRAALNHRKEWVDYWSTKDPDPVVTSTMGRDHFLWLLRALYHLDTTTMDYIDSVVQAQFCSHWKPEKRISIDETMRKFKGRSIHKVYAPDKPCKRGLKYYLAVDGLGFCVWFKPYRALPSGEKEDKITFKIIKGVMDILPEHEGTYYLYADNYYGSLEIAEEAASRNFRFTFGCRANRPSNLFANGLDLDLNKFGELEDFNIWVKGDQSMVAMTWKDKNLVRFLSNMASTEIVDTKQKFKGKLEQKFIPKIACDYTVKGMGHVDQYNAKLKIEAFHRNVSWRRTHFMSVLRIVLVNCYIYWKQVNQKYRLHSQNSFLKHFVDELEGYNKAARSKILRQNRNKRYREAKKLQKQLLNV